MKRLKRKIALMLAIATAWLGLSFSPMIVKAEDVVEKPTQESEILDSMDESKIPVGNKNVEISGENETVDGEEPDDGYNIDPELEKYLQPLICAAGGFGGTLMVILWAVFFFGKATKAFKGLVSWWKDKKEELANDGIDLAKIRDSVAAAVASNDEVKTALQALSEQNKEECKAFLSAVNTAIDAATNLVNTAESACEKRVALCEKEYQQIKEILILVATGNSELIRRGIADEIVKKFTEEKIQVEG